MSMPEYSPRLSLAFIQGQQAQKHMTHNEALARLDALVKLTVAGFAALVRPETAAEGEIWALGDLPVGAWAGQAGKLAVRLPDSWEFLTPVPGWCAAGGTDLRIWSGTSWVTPDLPALNGVPGLGIGTGYDSTNRLAVAGAASLLTHAGAGHQLKINKAGAGDTASLLFQTGWSGRAEMGLAGNDDFSVKVSAGGVTWTEALRLERATGRMQIPQGAVISGAVTGTAVTQMASDTTPGRLLKVGDYGLGGGINYTSSDDFNTVPAGFMASGSTSNVPANPPVPGTNRWAGLHVAQTAGVRGMQLMTNTGTAQLYDRVYESSVSAAWRQIYHAGSILGTVSQAAGVPTGRLIERGSNANGEYVRFADGTQICLMPIWLPVLTGVTTTTAVTLTATFPASFAGNPSPSLVADANTGATAWSQAADRGRGNPSIRATPTSWTAALYADGLGFSGAQGAFHVAAHGRWF